MKHPSIDWLGPDDVQAAALLDLAAANNDLSVFEVRDEADEQRVVTALALTRESAQEYHYAVFEAAELSALGVTYASSEGTTPDETVNGMHRNLEHLSAKQLARFASVISRGRYNIILKKKMRSLLVDALDSGTLIETRINEKLMDRIPTYRQSGFA